MTYFKPINLTVNSTANGFLKEHFELWYVDL